MLVLLRAAGRARGALVRAPAGMGKTAFCRRVAEEARGLGWQVRAMQASDWTRPYGLTADLAAGTPPDAAADALLDALRGRLIVAHAAWVERGFLVRAFGSRGARLRGGIVATSALR